jgi:endoglucanase
MSTRRRWLRRALGTAGVAALGLRAACAGAAPGPGASPPMRRGLNLTHWFDYARDQGVDAAELRALQALGFDHVRLPVDPLVCGWRPNDARTVPFVAELREAVVQAVDAGLAIVVDLHLEPSDKEHIEASSTGRAAIVELWAALSRALGDLPPSAVAFELFNEPQFYGLAAVHWPPFQRAMLQAVRAQAPRHTVLLTGNQGSSVEGLQRLTPLPDPAAVYVFHYYSPYLFTHQGAHWMDTRWTTAGLHQDVRYPSAQQAGRPLRVSRPHPRAADELQRYVDEGWDEARIRRELGRAAQWAARHGVPVVCNEFGVMRAAAEPASRYRWIGDVRRSLESMGIGWTLWDYTDIFGITVESHQKGRRGNRRIEPAALEALGRRGPAVAAARR